jgi:uncharacterized protein YndB with AHSA1/START domain
VNGVGVATRKHCVEVELPVSQDRAFGLLHTPSSICGWWSAARAIVIPRLGGVWVAAWGESEDDPDYVTAARITCFDPPRRLALGDFIYYARSGPLPFDAALTTEFTVLAKPPGSVLKVVQDGFPTDAIADGFYAGCETGWRNTFEGIKRFLARIPSGPASQGPSFTPKASKSER